MSGLLPLGAEGAKFRVMTSLGQRNVCGVSDYLTSIDRFYEFHSNEEFLSLCKVSLKSGKSLISIRGGIFVR